MPTAKIDELDQVILQELLNDSSTSVPKLSKKINANVSVVYSRIKRLMRQGLIKKFTIELDPNVLGYDTNAFVMLVIDGKYKELILKELSKIPEVDEIVEVTGRFDILTRLRTRSLDEMYDVISNKISKLEGVQRTETFVEMKRMSKAYQLPTTQRADVYSIGV